MNKAIADSDPAARSAPMTRTSNAEKPRRETLSDVAAKAGVSPKTVSRVLHQPQAVSAKLRRRVDAAIQEIGYIPNQLARGLASTRTGTIGILVPSLTNGVFADYLRALHDTLLPAGLQLLLINSRYLAGEEEKAITTLLGHHPEAIILAGIDQSPTSRRQLERAGIPVVQTMELTSDPIDINIGFRQVDAAKAATQLLIDLGHRRVGHIAARLDVRTRRRMDAYIATMRENGLTPSCVLTPQASTVQLAGELFGDLLQKTPRLDAVYCCNDDVALGVLFECQRRGIRVPDDVSVIGWNDLEFCASTVPALSSVATPRHEMGRRAGEAMLEVIRGSGQRPAERIIDLGFQIMERASTRARGAGPARKDRS
jgi:LacI family gluconate utilization system Gnt-I transcriptional repressor